MTNPSGMRLLAPSWVHPHKDEYRTLQIEMTR